MRSVSLRLVDLERKPLIPLGFEGENEYMTINFDCKTVFDKHPAAVPTLAVTPPQGDSYPAVVVRDGDIVSWTVCDSDLVYPGEGVLQLTFVDGTIIGKTYKARTKILDSITPSGEAPTPIQNWLIQAAAALQALPQDVSNAVVALMGAMVGVGETLDPDENVTVSYDAENNTLTIGVPKGKDGTDGNTPTITATKSGKVTTIYSDGVAIATIKDGEDGTEIIDDTTVSSESTWSSQKINDSKADKANPEFTGSISLGRQDSSDVGANSTALGTGIIAKGDNEAVVGMYNVDDTITEWKSGTNYVAGSIAAIENPKLRPRPANPKYDVYVCIEPNSDETFDSSKWEFVAKISNAPGKSLHRFAVGTGSSDQSRQNGFSVRRDGKGYFKGDVFVNCNENGTGGTKLAKVTDIIDPTSIIDDNAGDGDTEKTWSADKLESETSALLTEITNKISEPTNVSASSVGKAFSPKTVVDGKVTKWQFVDCSGGGGESYTQWVGKKWCALGTSITDTSYMNPNTGEVTGKYVPFLATKSGLLVTNRGVAGGRLVGGSGSYNLLSKILSYNDYSTFDIITIEGFVNDWAGNTPLGDLGDTGDTTFYGALYQAINYILSNCHAEVVLITDSTGRQVQNLINCDMWQQNTANLYQQDYNDAIIKTGQFFGIPVIDAGGRSQINKYHTEYLIDNIHHTTLGGEQYAKTIWEELKLLTPAEWKSYHTETGNPVSFETNVAEPMQITAKFVPVQSGSGDPSPTNVRNLSGITGATIYHSDDDTSNSTEYQITFPAGAGTLYAGRIDLTTGVLYADYKCINARDVTWTSAGASYMAYFKPSDAYTEITTETPNGKTEIFCNVLKYESGSSSSLNYYLVWGGTNNNGNIVVYDKDTANVQAWNNYIQNNDVQICYRLATPVQYQLTAEEVLSIIGENNLWSNLNGDLSVTYAEKD